jgi:hypothetical protein
VTIFITITNYGALPQRVPMHFWIDGTVNSWGPRPAVWLLPVVQLLIVGINVSIYPSERDHAGTLLVMNLVLAMTWRAQVLIVATATSGKDKAAMGGFWLFLLFTMAALFAIVFSGRL